MEVTSTIECQVIAIDLRGHGNTKTNDDSDLSLDTLAQYDFWFLRKNRV